MAKLQAWISSVLYHIPHQAEYPGSDMDGHCDAQVFLFGLWNLFPIEVHGHFFYRQNRELISSSFLSSSSSSSSASTVPQTYSRTNICIYSKRHEALLAKAEVKCDPTAAPFELQVGKGFDWNPVFMRNLPFVLGITIAGPALHFYVTYPDKASNEAITRTVASPMFFSFHSLPERFLILKTVLNFTKILFGLAQEPATEFPFPLFKPILRGRQSSDCTILYFTLDRVIKKSRSAYPEVYHILKIHRIPNVVSITATEACDGFFWLEITPLGRQIQPDTIFELLKCLSDILKALAALHNLKLCHRDLRWPNILFARSRWLLTDFEISGPVDEPVCLDFHGSKSMPPEFALASSSSSSSWNSSAITVQWTTHCDMYQVGHLIRDWITGSRTGSDDPNLILLGALERELCHESPEGRPSALQCIERVSGMLKATQNHSIVDPLQ